MNTLSAAGQIKAFFRAKWVELLFAVPAGIGASMLYQALSVFFVPNVGHAADVFRSAISSSSLDIGFVAFFGVIAYVVLRWRARNAPR